MNCSFPIFEYIRSRTVYGFLVLIVLLFFRGDASFADDRPNILWISCEDISPHLHCYGYEHAITPTLDALAARGVRYTRAFTTTPVCATNRSSIITGMYPTTIGTDYMRCQAQLPANVRCFTELLRDEGYYCTNNVKEDYNFARPASAWDQSSDQAHWRNRKPDQPFFAVFNFTLCHESKIWPRGEAHLKLSNLLQPQEMQDPEQLSPPPYYPDTPEVRRDWANYYENITQIDHQVADVLRQLEDDGLTESTIVFFWSDHGAGLPRAKRWIYDSGTHVPLIVSIPKRFRTGKQGIAGSVDDQLISFIDLAPTVFNLVHQDIPSHMQGRAFLGTDLSSPREFVVNVRDRMDGRYDMIRAVRDKRYRYIRNYMAWKPYAQYMSFAEVNQTMKALRRGKQANTLPAAARLFMSDSKPTEELYDTQADPHEINNLAVSPTSQQAQVIQIMRARLANWEVETGDLGLIPESILREQESRLGDCVVIMHQPGTHRVLSQVRQMIALNRSPKEQLEIACTNLSSTEPTVRYWAVLTVQNSNKQLGAEGISDEAMADLLCPLLNDNDATVRVTAANALYQLDVKEKSLSVLIAGLGDPSTWVQLLAANYLDELAPNNTSVITALENVDDHDGDNYVLWTAEHALHRIDGRELLNRWGRQ